jgi:hypothetical protein
VVCYNHGASVNLMQVLEALELNPATASFDKMQDPHAAIHELFFAFGAVRGPGSPE